jgi:hypothetical protein
MTSITLRKALFKLAAVLFVSAALISAHAKPIPEAKAPSNPALMATATPADEACTVYLPCVAKDYRRTPPEISNLEWQPTRVVNGKVYDGRVVFDAEDESSPIAYAELNFVPKEYPHLPLDAFPEEDPKKLVLEPLDGAFDELKEEFAADIIDIIGGREYEIVLTVKNQASDISSSFADFTIA